jgi:multiple sugar transport system ATP-binding protein/lactose/L-arabinose transport system ATP-binding protein
MTLADRIVVLRAGRVEQIGSPQELYDHPANTFVAGFIGSPKMNFLTVRAAADGGALALTHPSFAAPVRVAARNGFAGGELLIGLRPEQLMFESGPCQMRLKADLVENLGGATLIYGQTEGGETLTLQTPGRRPLKKSEAFSAGFDPAAAYLFTPDGRAL